MEPCKDLKKLYDDCFNDWFFKQFLRGNNDDSECAPLLKVYRECVLKAMKDQQIELKDVEMRHLGTDKEKR